MPPSLARAAVYDLVETVAGTGDICETRSVGVTPRLLHNVTRDVPAREATCADARIRPCRRGEGPDPPLRVSEPPTGAA